MAPNDRATPGTRGDTLRIALIGMPYWSARLGKSKLHAVQVSRRGGELYCEHLGDRVVLAGRVVEYLRGEIYV